MLSTLSRADHATARLQWFRALLLAVTLHCAASELLGSSCSGSSPVHHMNRLPRFEVAASQSSGVPLVITNQCSDTIYPAVLTQSGNGPGTGGFELTANSTRSFTVSENWQGRVWGRTNCSFNSAGTAPSGSTTNGQACDTGDCGGVVNCVGTGVTPTSLAEFTLDDGMGLTFYDLSLVDGYNLPLAIVLQPSSNYSLEAIPPNLTNPSCVGSFGDLAPQNFNPYTSGTFLATNTSDPLPFERNLTAENVAEWCPTDLEVMPLNSPSGGVYIYPDGNIDRPIFDPCYSACAKYNLPSDCCTGSYDSPSACSPAPYSKAAKLVCPDAYSYAFDDQTSTFIVPAGAGFEVVFCPGGRSTNILGTSKALLEELAATGSVRNHRALRPRSSEDPLAGLLEDDLTSADAAPDNNYSDGANDEISLIPISLMTAASLELSTSTVTVFQMQTGTAAGAFSQALPQSEQSSGATRPRLEKGIFLRGLTGSPKGDAVFASLGLIVVALIFVIWA